MTAADAGARTGEASRQIRQRLILALALIALAVAGLALFERLRPPDPAHVAPHEPAQSLIATPAAPGPPAPPNVEGPAAPPPPPVVINERDPPPAAPGAPATRTGHADHGYVVQAGVFSSSANARALRERLEKAGIRATIETRVQLGPYEDRREAERALAKLRALGVHAVVVPR